MIFYKCIATGYKNCMLMLLDKIKDFIYHCYWILILLVLLCKTNNIKIVC